MLKLFNTLSRKKEEFKPINKGKVSIYSCGPTVYNVPHIGNWRTFIFTDLLHRYLIWKGFVVTDVMNLTDVDDKTIAGAKKEGIVLREFTNRYAGLFFNEIEQLNILPAKHYPRATEHLNEMQDMIKSLLGKGLAYKSEDGSIYFSVKKFKEYGRLAHLNTENLKVGARVAQDDYEKGSAHDFALWKAYDAEDGDVFWDDPVLGKGRPGWHIECSAMSCNILGDHFDIHTGGVDLIFPHHENEIAQSQGTSDKKFVNYWLHAEHLQVDGKKMAKSLGNFFTLEDLFAKGYSKKAVRLFLLATHYRQQLNFTLQGLDAAKNTVTKFDDFMRRVKENAAEGKHSKKVEESIMRAREEFERCLDDDLSISEALSAVFSFMSKVNAVDLSPGDANRVLLFMQEIDEILGILEIHDEVLDPDLQALMDERASARKKKDFKESDRLRAELLKKGIQVDDTKDSARWKRIA